MAYGCIETDPKAAFVDRLVAIRAALQTLIKEFSPTRAAVEELFFYKNVTTAIAVGHARGVILLTCAEAGLPIDEYTPLQVKQAVSGYGRAGKDQVQKLIGLHFGLEERVQDDAADALAVALTAGVALAFKKRTA